MASKFSKKFTHAFLLRFVIPLIHFLHCLFTFTLRIEHVDANGQVFQHFRDGRRIVCAFFHCDAFVMAVVMRSFLKMNFGRVFLMVSRSRDGDLMAAFLERIGGVAVRGSSSRGGAQALLQMTRAMGPDDNAAIAVDGPRGPRFEMKQGALMLASLTGRPIVPVAMLLSSKIKAGSWDRMEFPLPFSRVTAYYGEPLEVPPGADAETLEALRLKVEKWLREMKGEGEKQG